MAKKSGNSKELAPNEEEKENPNSLKIKLKIKKIEKSPKSTMPTLKNAGNSAKIYTNSHKNQEIFITFSIVYVVG